MSVVLQNLVNQPCKHSFVTDIESDAAPKGLNDAPVRLISTKESEPEWLLEFRLKAYRDTHGAPLRAAGQAALQGGGDVARLVRGLQQHGRIRCIDRRHSHCTEGFLVMANPQALYHEVILDHHGKPGN